MTGDKQVYADCNKYALWLHEIREFGERRADYFRQAGLSAKDLWGMPEKELRDACESLFQGDPKGCLACSLLLKARTRTPEQALDVLRSKELQFVSIEDPGYPERLRSIPDAPYGLYFRGRLPSDREPSIAIIGARTCTGYGLSEAEHFARALSAAGVQVVSGLARGIDGAAGGAAAPFGRSFAVMGCGANVCYPKGNSRLYEMIAASGGIISEYPPDTQPIAKLFPPRNRIISGLSDAVFVIEARKEKSGTMITVEMALEQGRDVFALPGRVTDGLSAGCLQLIRQGAEAVSCPEDILEHFFGLRLQAPVSGEPEKAAFSFTPLQQAILFALKEADTAGLDFLTAHCAGTLGRSVSVREVTAALLQLQMAGAVTESYEGYQISGQSGDQSKR